MAVACDLVRSARDFMSGIGAATSEDVYTERRQLVNRLLRCQLTDYVSPMACSMIEPVEKSPKSCRSTKISDFSRRIDKMREEYEIRDVNTTGERMMPESSSCRGSPALLNRYSSYDAEHAYEDSSIEHKKYFQRHLSSKSKAADMTHRDSGFFERSSPTHSLNTNDCEEVRTLPYIVRLENRTAAKSATDNLQQGNGQKNKVAVTRSLAEISQIKTHEDRATILPEFNHHCNNKNGTNWQSLQHYHGDIDDVANTSSKPKCSDSDSDSIVSSYTLTDSQNTNSNNGIQVYSEYKSSRKPKSVEVVKHESMFSASAISLLYFPRRRRKSRIIRKGALYRF